MYRIKRNYQRAKKKPWLVDLLLKIKPSCFGKFKDKEECREALRQIDDTIKTAKVRWKRGVFDLSHITECKVNQDEIVINYKRGTPCLSFTIVEFKEESS